MYNNKNTVMLNNKTTTKYLFDYVYYVFTVHYQ